MNTAIDSKALAAEANKRMRRERQKRTLFGYAMFAPFFILFTVFVLLPVVWGFIISFTHYNLVQPMTFAGLENYRRMITEDSQFIKALSNTLMFVVTLGPFNFIFSFFIAWVISRIKYRNVFAMLFYVPSVLGVSVIQLIFTLLFSNDQNGLVNSILLKWDFIRTPILFKTYPQYIVPLVYFLAMWQSLGNGFLVNLAGLFSVPEERYEAAAIDGVRNRFQELIYITLPSMKPQLLYTVITTSVAVFNFNDIGMAVAAFPSPEDCVRTLVTHINDHGFVRYELGYASAIAFLLFLMSFLVGSFFMKVLSTKGE